VRGDAIEVKSKEAADDAWFVVDRTPSRREYACDWSNACTNFGVLMRRELVAAAAVAGVAGVPTSLALRLLRYTLGNALSDPIGVALRSLSKRWSCSIPKESWKNRMETGQKIS
jgi:hypothetical protein